MIENRSICKNNQWNDLKHHFSKDTVTQESQIEVLQQARRSTNLATPPPRFNFNPDFIWWSVFIKLKKWNSSTEDERLLNNHKFSSSFGPILYQQMLIAVVWSQISAIVNSNRGTFLYLLRCNYWKI